MTVMTARVDKLKKRFSKAQIRDMLVAANPGRDQETRATVWRKLRRHLNLEAAMEAYHKLYPKTKTIKRNRGDFPYKDHPQFKKGCELFRKFHGREPDRVIEHDLPYFKNDDDDPVFLVVLGETPAESYDANGIIKGSSKEGNTFVHKYESEDGKKPLKVVTVDGKFISTMPGVHVVKAWMEG